MKLMIDRGALLKTLAHAQSVVERRNTIPILSNLKLEVANGKVFCRGDGYGNRPYRKCYGRPSV